VCVGVGVGVAVGVNVGVGLGDGTIVGVGVALACGVGVGVALANGVGVGVGDDPRCPKAAFLGQIIKRIATKTTLPDLASPCLELFMRKLAKSCRLRPLSSIIGYEKFLGRDGFAVREKPRR
jgi:hypothetical protein